MSHLMHSVRLLRNTSVTFLALLLSTGLVSASDLVVQPSSLALAAKKPTATVKLVNTGTESKIVRIKVMGYSQENGREQLSPSTRLIVHPDQVTLKPGASQTVRVGMRLSGPLWDEETYRLLLTEITQSPDVGAVDSRSQNARKQSVAFLPVSVLPPGQSLSAR